MPSFAPEDAMSIIRLIHIKIDPSETEAAERIWKTECATLMISQKGCISEKLLRARDRGEFIAYSEWETEADIDRYKNTAPTILTPPSLDAERHPERLQYSVR